MRSGDRGDPQVGQLHRATGTEQHVGGLDVAVDDPPLVDRVKAGRHPGEDPQGLRGLEAALAVEQLAERLALDVLHDDDQVPVGGRHHVIDGDEVRMADRGAHERLAPQPAEPPYVGVAAHLLERDAAPEHRVLGEVDGRHPAGPEGRDDAVSVRGCRCQPRTLPTPLRPARHLRRTAKRSARPSALVVDDVVPLPARRPPRPASPGWSADRGSARWWAASRARARRRDRGRDGGGPGAGSGRRAAPAGRRGSRRPPRGSARPPPPPPGARARRPRGDRRRRAG